MDADMSAFRECLALSWKNPYVLRLAFSAGIGGLLFGYDTGKYIQYTSLYFYSILELFFPLFFCFSVFFSSVSICQKALIFPFFF